MQKARLGALSSQVTHGTQLDNPVGPMRGPKTIRVSTDAMRKKKGG